MKKLSIILLTLKLTLDTYKGWFLKNGEDKSSNTHLCSFNTIFFATQGCNFQWMQLITISMSVFCIGKFIRIFTRLCWSSPLIWGIEVNGWLVTCTSFIKPIFTRKILKSNFAFLPPKSFENVVLPRLKLFASSNDFS